MVRNPKSELGREQEVPAFSRRGELRRCSFGFRASSFFRPSDFGFRASLFLLASLFTTLAQPSPAPAAPDPLMSLMLSQPQIDVDSPVVATVELDPPVIRPGQWAVYRVSLNALEASVEWPAQITAPPQLQLRAGAHGQILAMTTAALQPHTTFNYRVRATEPGQFTIPEFEVKAYGKQVTVPSAQVTVVTAVPAGIPPPQELRMQLSTTNAFVGQAVRARVVVSSPTSGAMQSLGQVQINGEGFIVDQAAARPRIEVMAPGPGRPGVPLYVYETLLTPIASGKLSAFAQGFAVGNHLFSGVVIAGPNAGGTPPQYTLLDSGPVDFSVRPLPREGELPGFMGAVGTFTVDKPELATNVVSVGEPLKMRVRVYGDGDLARLVPPDPPQIREWQVLRSRTEPVAPQFIQGQGFVTFNFTLIPLTQKVRMTPAIPFCAFDPNRVAYTDLTIPQMAVTVKESAFPADTRALLQANAVDAEAEKEPVLSGLATAPGLAADGLVPLQRQLWFLMMQLAPASAFFGLWGWERRRRYLEQHPDVVLRRRARRALGRERRRLKRALRVGDASAFATSAVNAMRLACAPHYPAEVRALVGSDVLVMIPEKDRKNSFGDVVRRFFAVTDASRFSATTEDARALLSLEPELQKLLDTLEAKL